MVDVKCLSDCELHYQLDKLGFSAGPILPSTRRVYEKKLVQLLSSTTSVSLTMNGPREQGGAEDCDHGELNATIDLKGNIIISTEKSKELKKNPDFEIQEQWQEVSTTKPDYLDIYHLDQNHSVGIRCTVKSSFTREGSITQNDCCAVTRNVDSRKFEMFPMGFPLAVLGIFIIVLFVYITVEGKPS